MWEDGLRGSDRNSALCSLFYEQLCPLECIGATGRTYVAGHPPPGPVVLALSGLEFLRRPGPSSKLTGRPCPCHSGREERGGTECEEVAQRRGPRGPGGFPEPVRRRRLQRPGTRRLRRGAERQPSATSWAVTWRRDVAGSVEHSTVRVKAD